MATSAAIPQPFPVTQLKRANGLSTTSVRAGQKLRLPG